MRCIPVLMFAVAALLVAAETPSTTDPSDQRIAAIQKAQLGNPSSPEPHRTGRRAALLSAARWSHRRAENLVPVLAPVQFPLEH